MDLCIRIQLTEQIVLYQQTITNVVLSFKD